MDKSTNSDLRLLAVFLMGVSLGICLTIVYVTWRERSLSHYAPLPEPAAEVED